MDEKTKTIIDRARALLAAATPGPWEDCPDTRPDVRTTCNTGGFLGCGHIATVSRYDANEADAALIAAAPGLLATLCDAMDAADRFNEVHRAALEWAAGQVESVGCDCGGCVMAVEDGFRVVRRVRVAAISGKVAGAFHVLIVHV